MRYAERSERPITQRELDNIERYADKLFAKVGIDVEFTRHFLDRVNDVRNREQITSPELIRLFKKTYQQYGRKIPSLGPEAQAVIKDMQTDINIPFVLRWDKRDQQLELISKTVMRKPGFQTSNPVLAITEHLRRIEESLERVIQEQPKLR